MSNTETPSSQKTSVVEITSAPRYDRFLLERHRIDVPENYYVLAGNFEFFSVRADQTVQAQAGDVVQIPAGLPYGYKKTSSQPGKLILATTSRGFEDFIAEIGTAADDNTAIASISRLENIDKITTIARKYNIEFLN